MYFFFRLFVICCVIIGVGSRVVVRILIGWW